jgi:dienelactone hydrolase
MTWTDDGTLTGSLPTAGGRRFYRVRNWGVFTVSFTSNSFTYTDAQRTVTGLFRVPAGTGRFPALIINHGTGGTASPTSSYVKSRADEMSPWGLVCIGANLTHASGQTEDLQTWGYSPENLARVRACKAALSTRSDVDLNRLAMWGHSRGSFASIGIASDFGRDLKALGFTAGGVLENTGIYEGNGQPEGSYPILDEASRITAPTIMFHGSGDPAVAPSTSARLQTLLNTLGITNQRVVFTISGSDAHNLQNTSFYTEPVTGILDQWHAWLITHGVLP